MQRRILYIFGIITIAFICFRGAASGYIPAREGRVDVPDSLSVMLKDTVAGVKVDKTAVTTDSADAASFRRSIMEGREGLGADSAEQKEKLSRVDRTKIDIEDEVAFSAKDSLVMFGQNEAFMYGDGTVEYTELKLNAAEIKLDLDSATVYAVGVLDSTGNLAGNPVFHDKSGEYESKSMKYNFKTQRGYIKDVVTEQGEGYLTGGTTKKMEDGSFYLQDGKYTTCDDHEHPHFYFQITKARVVPKKNIVTGPVYMVLADVPLPLALPFGYFPFSKTYSSGIIFPSVGEDYNKGFYLQNGGYYFAINDNVDLAIRGEIFTKGSWGVSASSTYVKRYKYNGSFDLSYITTVTGDKGSPDYAKENNFRVMWRHTQDSKANPNLSLSASVDFTTAGYTRNDINSYYNSSFTQNTKSSTVNMTYSFPGTKWSISANVNIAQRTQDSTLSVSFPNLSVSMGQLAPFKRKRKIGGEKWFEKIRISYSGQFQNSLTANQNEFFKKNLIKDWRNGMIHRIPVQATFTVMKYFNVSPMLEMTDRMYTSKVRRAWDPNASAEVADTTHGFYNIFDFQASLAVNTKIYTFIQPAKFWGDKVQMIRYVLTPSVTLSGSPDFGTRFWGVYDHYDYVDNSGVARRRDYSYFDGAMFGVPARGKSGIVTYSLSNNLEMKVKSDNDSTGVKKISLIENLSVQQSYNFAADSLKWSNVNTSITLRLIKNFNLNLQATWDPYVYGLSPSGTPVRLNKLRISSGKGLPRLASTGTSFSYTFTNETFKRKKNNDNNGGNGNDGDEEGMNFAGLGGLEEGENDFSKQAAARREKNKKRDTSSEDADGYAAWSVPWSLTVNYSVNYGYGEFDYDKLEYKGRWTQNLSLNGNIRPTPNWNFSFSASYNFEMHKLAYMNCSISRDLHCFTMTASFVPVGPYKSYNFHIAVKSSLLQDLKYDKRSSQANGIRWY